MTDKEIFSIRIILGNKINVYKEINNDKDLRDFIKTLNLFYEDFKEKKQ